MRALKAWDPDSQPEPAGWFRNATTGRRRVAILGGDVQTWFEYIHH